MVLFVTFENSCTVYCNTNLPCMYVSHKCNEMYISYKWMYVNVHDKTYKLHSTYWIPAAGLIY